VAKFAILALHAMITMSAQQTSPPAVLLIAIYLVLILPSPLVFREMGVVHPAVMAIPTMIAIRFVETMWWKVAKFAILALHAMMAMFVLQISPVDVLRTAMCPVTIQPSLPVFQEMDVVHPLAITITTMIVARFAETILWKQGKPVTLA
jgi:hypothetical protein